MSLKKQIKELKAELQKRDEEQEQQKKNMRQTRISELEVEVKTYKEECLRLKQWLDDLHQQKAEPLQRD